MLHTLSIVIDILIISFGIYGIGLSLKINSSKDLIIDIFVTFLGVLFLLHDVL